MFYIVDLMVVMGNIRMTEVYLSNLLKCRTRYGRDSSVLCTPAAKLSVIPFINE